MEQSAAARFRYTVPAGAGMAHLVANPGTDDEQRVPFSGVLEIGRDQPGREALSGLLLVADPMVSHRHCIIVQSSDGHFYVRDVSRNGTRVGGRRLVPNVETEIRPGETLAVGNHHFMLDTWAASGEPVQPGWQHETIPAPTRTIATVLVGDIRNYTALVRCASSTLLQRSVSRVFEILTAAVIERGGTIKEYPGDAVVAFWESGCDGTQAIAACRAALELDRLARTIAADAAAWEVPGFPLLMDWALATGAVTIHTFGGDHPQGLSLVGEPVVLAFRLEQLAGADRGSILVCSKTRAMAANEFGFRDIGELAVKGFDRPDHVYALQERSDRATETVVVVRDGPQSPG